MKIIEPITKEEFEKYYQLRWEILRKPWNQAKGSELDDMEAQSFHSMICDDSGNGLAVCRLQLNTPLEGQIRYMAVRTDVQGKGIGKELLLFIEKKAAQLGAKKIMLDARENAVKFYKKNGYKILAKGYLLFGEIQHYKMEKTLKI